MPLNQYLPAFETSDDAYAFIAGLGEGEKFLLGMALLRDMKRQAALDLINDFLKEPRDGSKRS